MKRKLSQRTIEVRQRQDRALELSLAGVSLDEIAAKLNYAGPSSAHYAIKSALKRFGATPRLEELRQVIFARYNQLLRTWWEKATAEKKPDRRAATICLSILEDIRKMMGADAPAQLQVEDVTPRPTGLEDKTFDELYEIAQGLARMEKDDQEFLNTVGDALDE